MTAHVRSPSPLSEPEPDLDADELDPEEEDGGSVQNQVSRRSDRRPITEPPESFFKLLRESGALLDDDEEDEDDETNATGALQEAEASAEADGGCNSPVSPMPSARSPARTLRHRRGSTSPFSPHTRRRNHGPDRRLRQLRFNLEATPLRIRPPEPPPSLKQRAREWGLRLLTWLLASLFGFAMSLLFWATLLWLVSGLNSKFRDIFSVDLDSDGVWSPLELRRTSFVFTGVLLLSLAIARGTLAVYYFTWFGLRASRQRRRAVELQKTSPFFLTRLNSTVDHSMLEYLQSNYDSGGVSVIQGTPAAEREEETTRRMVPTISSCSSKRPSLRRDASDTQRSVSEYLSLEVSPIPSSTDEEGLAEESSEQVPAENSETPRNSDGPGRRTRRGSASHTIHMVDIRSRTATAGHVLLSSGDKCEGVIHRRSCKTAGSFSAECGLENSKKLQELTCRLADWNFDIFEVAELTPRPLGFVGFVCLDAYSKLVDFDKPKLVEFLREVESSYRKVPYHNSLHGAAVARMVYSFCAGCGLAFTQEYMEFTIVLAGLVHDIHHPGLTPAFLSKASMDGEWVSPITPPLEKADMELSLKYNDQSPLENMHCAVTFEFLKKDRTAFLPKEDVVVMRKPLVRAILGTDMAKHAETMTRLAALIDNLEQEDHETVTVPWHWPAKPPATADEEQRAVWERLCQEEFALELFLHAADIGNPTLPFGQWVRWNSLVQKEFWMQGDREMLEFGELISPPAGFDRNSTPKAEHAFTKGFMQYLSLPLFQKLHDLTQLPSPHNVCYGLNISGCLENLKKNLARWDDYVIVREPEPEDGEHEEAGEDVVKAESTDLSGQAEQN